MTMDPNDPAWPSGPALHLYDVETDSYRPCTQRDLNQVLRMAAAAARVHAILQAAMPAADDPDDDGG
jgi:hypothetical protein